MMQGGMLDVGMLVPEQLTSGCKKLDQDLV